MRAMSWLVTLGVLAGAFPSSAEAQFTKRIGDRIKQAVTDKKRQTEENAVNRAAEPADSAMARIAAPVDSLTAKAGGAAGAAVSRAGRGPNSAAEAEARIRQQLATGHADLPGISFEPAGASITPASEPSLQALVRIMTDSPGVFLIQVRPDPGDPGSPPELAAPRASALKAWLVGSGIPSERVYANGETTALNGGSAVSVTLMQ